MSLKNIDGDSIEPLPPVVSIPPDAWTQLNSSGFTDFLPDNSRRFANDFIEWICRNGQRLAETIDASSFYNENDEFSF